MGRLTTLVFVSIIAVAGSIGIAPPADAVPSCVNAGEVTTLGSAGCNLGSLNFADFAVSPVISEFVNSHDEPPVSTPEPATLVLLGGSLVAAGFATRRRAARQLASASGDSRELSASR